jgi:hypothetical protein
MRKIEEQENTRRVCAEVISSRGEAVRVRMVGPPFRWLFSKHLSCSSSLFAPFSASLSRMFLTRIPNTESPQYSRATLIPSQSSSKKRVERRRTHLLLRMAAGHWQKTCRNDRSACVETILHLWLLAFSLGYVPGVRNGTAVRFRCQHADHKLQSRLSSNSYFFCYT